ncbi:MAG TPA: hypothetical protein VM223_25795, partial [Planctomycetota bacterium]|nr:hypothetical protein [Planctomycetota bacterium]
CVETASVCGAGQHAVTLTITDKAGLSDSCDAIVTVRDETPPTITCPPDKTLEGPADTDPSNTGEPIADDACGPVTVTYHDEETPGPGCTKVIERTWTATDASENSSSCVQTITVVDTTPPAIQSAWAQPHVIWPPNHKMIAVAVGAVVSDPCDPQATFRIVSVVSSEPNDGLGKGDTSPDWEITGETTVNLRAERYGSGTGRTYTITLEARDACSNASTTQAIVIVPHDQSGGTGAVCPVCGQVHD